MSNQQPEALRLAAQLKDRFGATVPTSQAAAKLIHQHAEIERLRAERDKAHQDGIRAACERDSLLEQLAAAQREVVDRLAELAALQEDLRYVAHSGMGSCAKVHAAPAGWQLVPVEPTFEQIMAAARAAKQYMDECGGNSPTAVYQAMLAAAPKGGE